MTNTPWIGVPLDKTHQWNQAYSAPPIGPLVPGPCPICGAEGLRVYYDEGSPDRRLIDNVQYIARGGLWQWCTACRTFEHSQALIPESWKRPWLDLDPRRVTAVPEELDRAISALSQNLDSGQ